MSNVITLSNVCKVELSKHSYLGNGGFTNAMCWEGAVVHGVPKDWVGDVEISLSQFEHGMGHRVKLNDSVVTVGDQQFLSLCGWMMEALFNLYGTPNLKSLNEFYVAFKGTDGTYIPCPWAMVE